MTTKNWFDEAKKVAEVTASCPIHWIEIVLIFDEEHTAMTEGWLTAPTIKFEKKLGFPFQSEPYELKRPDGELKKGQLDGKGTIRQDDVPDGKYEILFPDALGKRSRKPGEWG